MFFLHDSPDLHPRLLGNPLGQFRSCSTHPWMDLKEGKTMRSKVMSVESLYNVWINSMALI